MFVQKKLEISTMKQQAKDQAKEKEKTNKTNNLKLAVHVAKELQALWKNGGKEVWK